MMYIRISFINDDKSLSTFDFKIDHFVYYEDYLSLYDSSLSIFDIPTKYIYYFTCINKFEVGIEYKCYNDLDFAFNDIGFKEVSNEPA